jgi:hypothetical protein
MKLLLTLFFVSATFCINVDAQNYFEEFGKISQSEIAMTSCSYDPTADAVVLFDVGKSYFERVPDGFDVKYRRITRIKILNEAGIKYAEVAIPFYQEGSIYEKVEIEKASTYNFTDGRKSKITDLEPSSCYVEKASANWKTKKFAMPDVHPGSIVEFMYTVTSQYHFNLRDWDFQWSIPVLYSSYEVHMIPFYEYTWAVQGRKSLDEFTSYEENNGLKERFYTVEYYDMVYKFGLKNVAAFADEEFIPSREDYITKIDFQLSAVYDVNGVKRQIMTTWPELVTEYLKNEDFGKYLKKSENSALKVLNPDSLAGKTQMQLFDYIIDFTKDNYSWNNVSSQFSNKSVSEFLKDKRGNSADINLWLVGAFRAAGLESYPVVISTRDHGKIKSDYPFSSSFNFVLAYVVLDGKTILADATDPFCQNNKIPIQCVNDKGLIVDKNKLNWLSLQTNSISGIITNIKIDSIAKDQKVSITTVASDYEALAFRNLYADKKDIIFKDLSKKNYHVNDSSLQIRYATNRKLPYAYSYSMTSNTEHINGKIYIQPFINEIFAENPLKQKTRTYPIDMTYPHTRTYKSEILIPDGYKIDFMPTAISLNDELFNLDYSATDNKNSVNVSLTYTFKHSVYSPEEYSRVKTLFDRIVKKSSEKIVFVKK